MGAPDWRAAVRIQPEPLRESDLLARLAQGTSESAVWVTDLLDPRPAFYRRRVRVPVSPERRARQASGRQLHALIGSALAAPGVLEVRVRREGVVGQIDLLEKEPTELKTTESLPDPGTLRSSRASYLDQLGLYGALTGRDRGRLVVVEVVEGAPRRCQVYLVRFRAASELLDEMRRRARAFRAADEQNTPRDLPRCAWFGRGCEFQEARACECRGDEAPASDAVVGCVESIDLSEPLGLALEARLRSLAAVDVPATIERFRDLLNPRRA
ncbi:MAG TPA: hypothetical protein VEY07_05185 [Thermoplasmata archaeon]|nr:hypothetical protein [Thermoplasmata archaeon]